MPGKPSPENQCAATSKRTGERCEAWAMTGKEVCYHHGGKSPIAAGSASFKDGSHSKYRTLFSGNALEHYRRASDDPCYIELREEILLLDALIFEELIAAREGEGAALWEELGEQWRRFSEADPTKHPAAAGRALRRVGELIRDGVGRHAAQERAVDLIERKRKLSETERRRLVGEQRTITEEKALAFAAALAAVIRRHVTDREVLANVHADIARLIHENVSEGAARTPNI